MFDFNDVIQYLRAEENYDDKQLALFSYFYDEGDFPSVEEYLEEEPDGTIEDYVLNCDITNSYGNEYTSDYGDYLVFDSEEEAYDAAVDDISNLFDELGMEGFNFSALEVESMVDTEWFRDAWQEMNESYAQDIESESSSRGSWAANRLIEECIDAGIIDEDELDEDGEYMGSLDIVQELADFLTDGIDDYVEEYKFQLGEEELNYAIKEYNLIDVDELARQCIETDGIAHFLASYDGYENEQEFEGNTYYMYRTN